jgi:hypothetical protein
VAFDVEINAQELIARFGNSHLLALSQLRSLASAFASDKRTPDSMVRPLHPPIPSHPFTSP